LKRACGAPLDRGGLPRGRNAACAGAPPSARRARWLTSCRAAQ